MCHFVDNICFPLAHISFNHKKQLPGVFCKKVFFKISQNSQKNTCARVSFLIKLQVATRLGDCFCTSIEQSVSYALITLKLRPMDLMKYVD